ncbi:MULTISPECIES: hypothetical protein [Streptomyces]|uniref:hypothetical protein n=1 Tax=Streptomyces TaxID=1883 RepID=UPI0004CDCFA5|nr:MULTISPECIES: hypothetical protein [Streptomyces]KOT57084.1 hypothetical protein ADK43_21905 [Streptomyces rimosus subsp. rimosus]
MVDAIALGLGTSPEWPGTETLEWIANTIGKVRNHPGGRDPREYRDEFAEERAFDPREDGFLAKYLDEGIDEVDDKEERGLTVTGTSAGLKQLADQLKHHLEEAGYKTTQAAGSSVRSFTVNVWFPDGSYPVETITLTDSTKSQGFSWGHGYVRELPLDTPVKEVAGAVHVALQVAKEQLLAKYLEEWTSKRNED